MSATAMLSPSDDTPALFVIWPLGTFDMQARCCRTQLCLSAPCHVQAALLRHTPSARSLCCRIEFCTSGHDDQGLPYELHALEVPLATTVRLFESETLQLEKLLLPSLERLSARVSRVQGWTGLFVPSDARALLLGSKALELTLRSAGSVALCLAAPLPISSAWPSATLRTHHSGTSALCCIGSSSMELRCSLPLALTKRKWGSICSTQCRPNPAAEVLGQQDHQWPPLLSGHLQVSKRELLSIQSSKATLNRLVERVRRAKEASARQPPAAPGKLDSPVYPTYL